jgi:hypothetical protein
MCALLTGLDATACTPASLDLRKSPVTKSAPGPSGHRIGNLADLSDRERIRESAVDGGCVCRQVFEPSRVGPAFEEQHIGVCVLPEGVEKITVPADPPSLGRRQRTPQISAVQCIAEVSKSMHRALAHTNWCATGCWRDSFPVDWRTLDLLQGDWSSRVARLPPAEWGVRGLGPGGRPAF